MSNEIDIVDELASQVDGLSLEVQSCLAQTSPQDEFSPSVSDLRTEPRLPLNCPLIAIPLRPNGQPDLANRVDGTVRDVSVRGIGALLESNSESGMSDGLLIGVRGENGEYRYAGVNLKHFDHTGEPGVNIGVELGGQIQKILDTGTITPVFRPDRMEFAFDYTTQLLESLEYLGVLQETVLDRVQLCPRCQGIPTFRQGCRKCGSARFATDQLIHHFACAHVAPVADFEAEQGLVCPKCRTRHIVVGADFEYLTGQYHCLDCHAKDTELGQIGHCLRCAYRFPGHQSIVQDVMGFHAHRLDPLDLLTTY